MEQHLYFTHFTSIVNCANILKSGYLYTTIERIREKIKYEGVGSTSVDIYPENAFLDEFPGNYLNGIAKHHIGDIIPYWGPVMLVFSRVILQQQNWHFNMCIG